MIQDQNDDQTKPDHIWRKNNIWTIMDVISCMIWWLQVKWGTMHLQCMIWYVWARDEMNQSTVRLMTLEKCFAWKKYIFFCKRHFEFFLSFFFFFCWWPTIGRILRVKYVCNWICFGFFFGFDGIIMLTNYMLPGRMFFLFFLRKVKWLESGLSITDGWAGVRHLIRSVGRRHDCRGGRKLIGVGRG